MVKDVKYIYWVKKKTCLGVLDRGDRGKDNETGLKEEGGIKIEIYRAPFAMHALSLKNTYHRSIVCTARQKTRFQNERDLFHRLKNTTAACVWILTWDHL